MSQMEGLLRLAPVIQYLIKQVIVTVVADFITTDIEACLTISFMFEVYQFL